MTRLQNVLSSNKMEVEQEKGPVGVDNVIESIHVCYKHAYIELISCARVS